MRSIAASAAPRVVGALALVTVASIGLQGCSSSGSSSSEPTDEAVITPPNPAPDLVVESTSVSDANPSASASFTLRTTVRNRGDGSSAATTLRYYRSSDATISSSDTQVGTDSVSGLAASATNAESVALTAPSTAGTYYYGACVDSVADESNTGNNCSSAVEVSVTVDETGDGGCVEVDDVIALGEGESCTITQALVDRYSLNRVSVSVGDTATCSGGRVALSFISARSIQLNGLTIRCLDAMDASSPSSSPDLVVESASVSDPTPTASASFTLRTTVRNRGDGSSAATTLRYYRSSDATISSSDTQVGTDSVSGLAASATNAESVALTAPSTAGTYYYGACVDSVADESNTGNNCSSAVEVSVTVDETGDGGCVEVDDVIALGEGESCTITQALVDRYSLNRVSVSVGDTATCSGGRVALSFISARSIQLNGLTIRCLDAMDASSPSSSPDLVVESASVSDPTPTASASFTLRTTVRNRGDGSSAATTLRYYRSSDATISSSDTQVGTDSVSGLAASATNAESVALTAPSTAGTYYYGACVDSVADESNTGNNCSSAVEVSVTVDETGDGGCVEVDDVIALGEGESCTITQALVDRYSLNRVSVSVGDTATCSGGRVALSFISARSIQLNGLTIRCLDAMDASSPSSSPDLVVESASVSDPTPTANGSFTLSATVRNRGDGSSAATTLRYYRSSNARISSSDTQVGTDAVSGLAASATSSESISLTAPSTAGTYYYGACVDAVAGESNAGNNCSTGARVDVSSPGGGASDSYCRAGDTLQPGQSCTIYTTSFTFDVESSGRGCLRAGGILSCSGNGQNLRNTTLNGVRITFVARRNANDSWTIDEIDPSPDGSGG